MMFLVSHEINLFVFLVCLNHVFLGVNESQHVTRKNSINYNFRECYLYENEKRFGDNFSIVMVKGICGRILSESVTTA